MAFHFTSKCSCVVNIIDRKGFVDAIDVNIIKEKWISKGTPTILASSSKFIS